MLARLTHPVVSHDAPAESLTRVKETLNSGAILNLQTAWRCNCMDGELISSRESLIDEEDAGEVVRYTKLASASWESFGAGDKNRLVC